MGDDVSKIKYKSNTSGKWALLEEWFGLWIDDFKNRCGEGHHPLMNQIKAVLGPKMTADEEAARSQRSVQRTSILKVPEGEETGADGVEEFTNEIENKNETDETWMFYTAMQPIQQLWYYLVPSS